MKSVRTKRQWPPECHFLEAEVAISTSKFTQILHGAIKKLTAKPEGFWIKNLHFFNAVTAAASESVRVKYSIADIPDAEGYSSKTITDDQFKAALTNSLLPPLLGVAKELWEMQDGLGMIRVVNFERMPSVTPIQEHYRSWLKTLHK